MRLTIFILLLSSTSFGAPVATRFWQKTFDDQSELSTYLTKSRSELASSLPAGSSFAYTKSSGVMDTNLPPFGEGAAIPLSIVKYLFSPSVKLDSTSCERFCLEGDKNLYPGIMAKAVIPEVINFKAKYTLKKPTPDTLVIEVNIGNYDAVFNSTKMVYKFQPCTPEICGSGTSKDQTHVTVEKLFAVKPEQPLASSVASGAADAEEKDHQDEIDRFEAVAKNNGVPEGDHTTTAIASQ